jgi:hypothetical protein
VLRRPNIAQPEQDDATRPHSLLTALRTRPAKPAHATTPPPRPRPATGTDPLELPPRPQPAQPERRALAGREAWLSAV